MLNLFRKYSIAKDSYVFGFLHWIYHIHREYQCLKNPRLRFLRVISHAHTSTVIFSNFYPDTRFKIRVIYSAFIILQKINISETCAKNKITRTLIMNSF